MSQLIFIARLVGFSRHLLSILLTTAALALVNPAWAQSNVTKPIDIVFDLDWTLINPTTPQMAEADPRHTVRFNEDLYRFTDHIFEVLLALHDEPRVRVSFFSGGIPERNNAVIKIIYDELRQRRPGKRIDPYLILSKDHLTLVSDDPSLKFSQRYKKDLGRYFELSGAVLVDDIQAFAPAGQEKNMVWVGKTYNDRPRFDMVDLENPAEAAYSAPNEAEWRRDRDRLLPVLKIIRSAIRATATSDRSFVDLVGLQTGTIMMCASVL